MNKIISISALDMVKRKIGIKRSRSCPVKRKVKKKETIRGLSRHKPSHWALSVYKPKDVIDAEFIDDFISENIKSFEYFRNVCYAEIKTCFEGVDSSIYIKRGIIDGVVNGIETEHRRLVLNGSFADPESQWTL